jgi:hypothetical protein
VFIDLWYTACQHCPAWLRATSPPTPDAERQGQRYLVRERRYGQFQRNLTLPTSVQADQVRVDLTNGIRTLTRTLYQLLFLSHTSYLRNEGF